MKQLTWEEYYDGFYDWVPSTQKSYAYRLSDYGSADEVWEIAEELDFEDSAFAARTGAGNGGHGGPVPPEQNGGADNGSLQPGAIGRDLPDD